MAIFICADLSASNRIADIAQLADKHSMLELRPIHTGNILEATGLCIRAKAHWGYSKAFVAACVPGLTLTENDLATSKAMGAFDFERLVGVAQIAFDGEECLLDKLFVEPDWIGNGVGRKLFGWCRDTACAHGAARMVIESDPFAEPIYLAMGCRKIGYVRSELTHRDLPLLEFALAETINSSDDNQSPNDEHQPIVTLNSFQGPFLHPFDLRRKAKWMLKQVQHDKLC